MSGLSIALTVATVAVLLWITIVAPERMGKGRLTRALRVLPPRRVFSQPWVRFTRYLLLAVVGKVASDFFTHDAGELVYWGGAIVFLLDDYVTGDDDRWRRFKDAVRNKIRWLMELPSPAEPTTA